MANPGKHDPDYIEVKRSAENTFRVEPNKLFADEYPECLRFMDAAVDEEMYKLGGQLSEEEKERLCLSLTEKIKRFAVDLGVQRYKYVAMVTIGDKKRQSVRVCSRCLWLPAYDRSVSVTRENFRHFLVATLYAVYSE